MPRRRYCHNDAQKHTGVPLKNLCAFCGLLSIGLADAAVVNVSGKLSWQLEIVVDDVFEVNARGTSIGEECNQRGFALVLLILGYATVMHRVAESGAFQHLCLREAEPITYF